MRKGKRRFRVLAKIDTNQNEFVRIGEFVKNLGDVISERTIRRMINAGEIETFAYEGSGVKFVAPQKISEMAKRKINEEQRNK